MEKLVSLTLRSLNEVPFGLHVGSCLGVVNGLGGGAFVTDLDVGLEVVAGDAPLAAPANLQGPNFAVLDEPADGGFVDDEFFGDLGDGQEPHTPA